MQYVILGLLHLSPLSLYDLHRAFTQGISLFYSASFGSIQRAIRQLQDSGLVETEPSPGDPRGRKVHSITASGREAFAVWMRSPVTGADAETTMLARVFFLGIIEDAEERDAVVGTLQERVSADLRGLQSAAEALDSTAVPVEFAEVFRFQRATLDYGLRAHELAARWLTELGADASAPARPSV